MRFVLLEHDTRPAPDAARAPGDKHFDLMIDLDGIGALRTWRLPVSPIEHAGPIPAECIADHRRDYLDYEGEISANRGRVRRCDAGPCACAIAADGAVCLTLRGRWLIGEFRIVGGRFDRVRRDEKE